MSAYVASLNYAFSPSAGTITFSGNKSFSPLFLKAVTDQSQNAFLYLPGIPNYGGSWDATGTILTLQQSVSSYASTDQLLFQYDDQGDALLSILSVLQGTNCPNDPSLSTLGGAVFRSPNLESLLQSLIAEVRVQTMTNVMLAREEIDLDALKRAVLDEMHT